MKTNKNLLLVSLMSVCLLSSCVNPQVSTQENSTSIKDSSLYEQSDSLTSNEETSSTTQDNSSIQESSSNEDSSTSKESSSFEESSSSSNQESIEQSSSSIESENIPDIAINEIKGLNEMISISINKEENVNYSISYKKSIDNKYIKLDTNLIKVNTDDIYAEVIGISKGTYDIKVSASYKNSINEEIINNIEVSSIDRSGYASFNNEKGIGAYNNDGTIKDNTIVLYLNNENKNTIEATFSNVKYVGIVDILTNVSKANVPVLIRVDGKITTNQFEYKQVVPRLADNSNLSSTHFENTFSKEYGENVVGLTLSLKDKKEGKSYQYVTTKDGIERVADKSTSKSTTTYTRSEFPELQGKTVYDDDCALNYVYVKNANNLTIEGLFDNAEIFQWGFSFVDCNSVEIKNLIFTDYQEDAIGISSNATTCDQYKGYFIHNNVFNRGKNNWDLTGEQDKYAGDGSLDIHNVSNVTVSYNEFNKCNKTGLVGSSNTATSKNITFHHNYYKQINSRLPLARHANIHIYNNFYENCSSCLNIQYNAYAFSEENYFLNSSNCHKVNQGVIKSYNDIFSSSTGVKSSIVSSRDEYVDNNCVIYSVSYQNFDVNENLFYYDKVNKCSDVSILNKASDVKAFLNKYCGIKGKYTQLPLTDNEELNDKINSNDNVTNTSKINFDLSQITSSTVIEDNSYIQAGDFKIYYGFDFAETGERLILKNLGSTFSTKKGLIEFTSTFDGELNIDFASRNATATDRYVIIYDENGKELYKSECANGNNRTVFTFEVKQGVKYYIGSYKGISFYSIY